MYEHSYRAFVHRKKTEGRASIIQSGDTGMQRVRITACIGILVAPQSGLGYARRRHVSSGSDYVFVRRQLWLGRLHKVWLVLGPKPSQLPFGPASLSARASGDYCDRIKLRTAPPSPINSPASRAYCKIASDRLGVSVAVAMS